MRAVVDNNLLVSGLLWGGKPGCLLHAVAEGRLQLYFNQELFGELGDVLQRKKFAARLAAKGFSPETALAALEAVINLAPSVHVSPPAKLRDPDDVHILWCAAAARVDAIITGDKDLLMLHSFAGIPIIPASEALRRLGLQ